MPGPSQDDRNKEQGQSISAGTMGGNEPPPPPPPHQPFPHLQGAESPQQGQSLRDEHLAATRQQTKDQQAMTNEMNKGRGHSDDGQSQQQNQEKTQQR
jgi:hypothetical protein